MKHTVMKTWAGVLLSKLVKSSEAFIKFYNTGFLFIEKHYIIFVFFKLYKLDKCFHNKIPCKPTQTV